IRCEHDARIMFVTREKELRGSALIVCEIGWPGFGSGGVHTTPQRGRRLPGEIVVHIIAVRSPDVIPLRRDSPRNEEEPVLVARKTGLRVIAGAVHPRWQRDGLLPRT